MSNKGRVPISKDDILQHLRDEQELLRNSAEFYDRGSMVEIKNMSARIRNLLHDGKYSPLLKQCGDQKGDIFYGTMGELKPAYFSEHKMNADGRGGQVTVGSGTGSPLITMACKLGPSKTSNSLEFYPNLQVARDFPEPPDAEGFWRYQHVGESKGFKKMSFDPWWKQDVVFSFDGIKNYSRKRMITDLVANQDGGTHTDPFIEIEYYFLLKKHCPKFCQSSPDGKHYSIGSKIFPIVRQITLEISKTLDDLLAHIAE